MAMDRRALIKWISIGFSATSAGLVMLGALVMMYGNFELGVILFVLGLVLVISNEGILPHLHPKQGGETRLIEEIASIAGLGYTPPILLGSYLYFTSQIDFKLVIFMAITFVVVTTKIFAKVMVHQFQVRPVVAEEVYSYQPTREEFGEPGV